MNNIQRAGYASASFGKGLMWGAAGFFWLYFLTDILEIDPATAGLIFMAALVWDGLTDPVMGYIADRTHTRMGKYRPFILGGAPLIVIAFFLTFSKPDIESSLLPFYALATGVLFRTSFTIIDLPHSALLSRATRTSEERATLAGWMQFFGFLSNLPITLAAAPILLAGAAQNEARQFQLFAIAVGLIAASTFLICFFMTRSIDTPARREERIQKISVADIFGSLPYNGPLWITVVALIVGFMVNPVFGQGLIYYSKYVLYNEGYPSIGLTAGVFAGLVSVPIWAWAARSAPKAVVLQIAFMVKLIACVAILLLPLATPLHMLTALVGLVGASSAGAWVLTFSMLPDVVDYGEWKSGRRIEAVVFALAVLAIKVATGMGGAVVGWILGRANFAPNVQQTQEASMAIKFAMAGVPVVGCAIVVLLLFFYRLDHARHKRIATELAARQSA